MTGHNGEPHLTVITAVLNGAEHIESTILSVLKPHPVPIVFLVIDGNSDDGTQEILERYSDSINYWSSEPDRGIYDAMNKGWAAASDNSFILYLGAGDRILALPRDMGRYSPDEVIYGVATVGDDTEFRPRCDYRLRFYNSLHHQALLINKRLHPEPPFDTTFRRYADFDLNQRLLKRGTRFMFDETFQSFALPWGVTATLDLKESLAVIRKNFGVINAGAALAAFAALRCFPALKRFRPFMKRAES